MAAIPADAGIRRSFGARLFCPASSPAFWLRFSVLSAPFRKDAARKAPRIPPIPARYTRTQIARKAARPHASRLRRLAAARPALK